jgi:hypothetical protein
VVLGVAVAAAHGPAAQAVPPDATQGDPLVADSGAVPVQSEAAPKDAGCVLAAPDDLVPDDSHQACPHWADSGPALAHWPEADSDPDDHTVAPRAAGRCLPVTDWAALIPDDCSEWAWHQDGLAVPMDAHSAQAEPPVQVDRSEQEQPCPGGSVAPKDDRFGQAERPVRAGCSVLADSAAADSAAQRTDDRSGRAEPPVRVDCLAPADWVAGGCSPDWLRGAHSAPAVGLAAQPRQDDCLHPAGLPVADFRPDVRSRRDFQAARGGSQRAWAGPALMAELRAPHVQLEHSPDAASRAPAAVSVLPGAAPAPAALRQMRGAEEAVQSWRSLHD